MALTQRVATVYKHLQEVASSTWVITHSLGMYPVVDVFIDYDGEQHRVMPSSVEYTDLNTCTLVFTAPRTGFATVA